MKHAHNLQFVCHRQLLAKFGPSVSKAEDGQAHLARHHRQGQGYDTAVHQPRTEGCCSQCGQHHGYLSGQDWAFSTGPGYIMISNFKQFSKHEPVGFHNPGCYKAPKTFLTPNCLNGSLAEMVALPYRSDYTQSGHTHVYPMFRQNHILLVPDPSISPKTWSLRNRQDSAQLVGRKHPSPPMNQLLTVLGSGPSDCGVFQKKQVVDNSCGLDQRCPNIDQAEKPR